MGSYIEINDTLQITTEQGFPEELTLDQHLKKQYTAADFKDRIFEFRNKDSIRIFHAPPVRVFWAHNINNQWLYWGQVEIIELTLDMVNKKTSGKYKIIKIFTPEEMKEAEVILNQSQEKAYFFNQKTK